MSLQDLRSIQKQTPNAYPLHGKELDLIGSAFEEPENVPEHRHGPLQVARGPLADYTRCCIHDDLTQQHNRNGRLCGHLQLNRRSNTGTSGTPSSASQRL